MLRSSMLLVLLVLAATATAAPLSTTPTPESVLARYVEALGGRAALDTLEVRICSARFIDDRPYRGPADTTSCLIRAAAGVACEIVSDGGVRRDGTSISGERSKLSCLLDPRGALTLARDFPGLRYDGEVVVDGRRAHRLVGDRAPDHDALHFDAETGLLLRIGNYWDVSDWRETDGALAPHRIECGRKGGVNVWIIDGIAQSPYPSR